MAVVELEVGGMSCQGCVRSVSAIVSKELGGEGVEVEVDLEGGRVCVATVEELSAERIAQVVERLGGRGFAARVVVL